MTLTGSHISYLHLCHRKLWLHGRSIRMEDNSQNVHEGILIHETTYTQRAEKWTEVALDGIKIDYYDARNGVVHEVKKSDKHLESATAQVKYYLWVLEQNGLKAEKGVLEFPKQKETLEVRLSESDRLAIPNWEAEITRIVESETCPEVIKKPICKQCSFFEFCYANDL
jgi:CRISPR-associated exonuclease Cas4